MRGANLPEEWLRLQGDDTQLSPGVQCLPELSQPSLPVRSRKTAENKKVILSDLHGFILIYSEEVRTENRAQFSRKKKNQESCFSQAVVYWVHMSGAEECFLWLDVDASRAALLCVGATAPSLPRGGGCGFWGSQRAAWHLLPEGYKRFGLKQSRADHWSDRSIAGA